MRKRYGGNEADADSLQHPRGCKRPQQLKQRLHHELFCFFFADLVRERAAPFVTAPFTNIASPLGQSASENQNFAMSFTIIMGRGNEPPSFASFHRPVLDFREANTPLLGGAQWLS